MANQTDRVRHATVVACDGVLGTSLGITTDLYALLETQLSMSGKSLTSELVSVDGQPVTSAGKMVVQVSASIEAIEHTDLVMLPSFWGDVDSIIKKESNLIPWLQKQYENGAILVAHATAVFFLAKAGILDGKKATTHWVYINKLEKMFPNINVCRDRHITTEENIYCSAGLSSAMDLGMHLVEHIWGEKTSKVLEQNFVADFQRGYESPFIDFQGNKSHGDKVILNIQQWMEINFNKNTDLDNLAQRFGISLRSLKRHFKGATGETPLGYMQRLRIEKAKELLKKSTLAISQISNEVGYEDVSYFGNLFKRNMGKTPKQYRDSNK